MGMANPEIFLGEEKCVKIDEYSFLESLLQDLKFICNLYFNTSIVEMIESTLIIRLKGLSEYNMILSCFISLGPLCKKILSSRSATGLRLQ